MERTEDVDKQETVAVARPLATFTVFAYNQAKYVREAVEAALSQTYRPLQVVLSDDASTDNTFEVMADAAKACPADVQLVLNRNECNIGIAEHINKVMGMCVGDYVVLSAGDDVSLPERTAVSVAALQQDPRGRKVAFSAVNNMTASGQFQRKRGNPHLGFFDAPLAVLKRDAYHTGSSVTVERSLYETFPKLHRQVVNEDKVSAFRAAFFGGAIYIDEPLVHYREGIGMASMQGALLSGRDDPVREASYMKTTQQRRFWLLEQMRLDCANSPLKPLVDRSLREALEREYESARRVLEFMDHPSLLRCWRLFAAMGFARRAVKISVLFLFPGLYRFYKIRPRGYRTGVSRVQ